MPSHKEKRIFSYSTLQLFNIVNDIEKYPEFISGISSISIKENMKKNNLESEMLAETTASFKAFRISYLSKVVSRKPFDENNNGLIIVELVKGPFQHLRSQWIFEPILENKTSSQISFNIDFAFKSKILDRSIGRLFSNAAEKTMKAFEKRAISLYGIPQKISKIK